MAETVNYQCPSCNGRMFFDGETGKLQCEFCGSSFTTEEIERLYAEEQAKSDAQQAGDRAESVAKHAHGQSGPASQAASVGPDGIPVAAPVAPRVSAAEASTSAEVKAEAAPAVAGEDPIATYLRNAKWHQSGDESLRAYTCSDCGAQLMVDQVTAVTTCPYCGNNAVLPGQLSDVLQPDYVIPFKLDKDAAVKALEGYYQGKRFLPKNFTAGNHIEEIQGLYVPFWLYSGTGTGDIDFNAENVRAWSDSDYDYVDTDHYLVHREGYMQFSRVPVDGSTKMPDAHMDAIEPFDYSEMVPFSTGYLPGYLTDRYDQDARTCQSRMETRVEATCIDALQDTVTGYESVSVRSAHTNMNLSQVSYALLPVWMLHTRWNDEDYLFAMNGQTGRLVGDLPVDKGKAVRGFLMVFVPLLVAMALIVNFTMGFGF